MIKKKIETEGDKIQRDFIKIAIVIVKKGNNNKMEQKHLCMTFPFMRETIKVIDLLKFKGGSIYSL